jgi:AcrR family transcriptional regulator
MTKAGAAASDRVRRSPEEVRRLLEAAALEEFAAQGLAGTSTRAIADRAGVSESLLFRHYGTKAGLFRRTVLAPVSDFIKSWIEGWSEEVESGDLPPEISCLSYVGGLYDLLTSNRDLLIALIAAQAYEPDMSDDGSGLSAVLPTLEDLVVAAVKKGGYSQVDPAIAVRIVFGMVLSMAVLEQQMYPYQQRRPNRDRIVHAMANFMMHGLSH